MPPIHKRFVRLPIIFVVEIKNVRTYFVCSFHDSGLSHCLRSRKSNDKEPHIYDDGQALRQVHITIVKDIYRCFVLTPIFEFARFRIAKKEASTNAFMWAQNYTFFFDLQILELIFLFIIFSKPSLSLILN